MEEKYIITDAQAGQRLDVFCTTQVEGLSRSAIQKAIKSGGITVNGKEARPKDILRTDDVVELSQEHLSPSEASAEPALDIRLPVLYEDRDVVVIEKPAGVTVHHGVGAHGGTVSDWFTKHYPDAVRVGEEEGRAGIVHRLDKDTSGVLILAKNDQALEFLKKQFKDRRAKKEYVALVFGVPGGSDGRITKGIARSRRNPMRRTVDESGKEAVTEWRIERKFGERFALVRVYPFTGRTHQIRVHLHHIGHPIVGDHLYTFKRQKPPEGVTRQLLHAEKLTITLPSQQVKTFVAPLASDFEQIVEKLAAIKWPKKIIKT